MGWESAGLVSAPVAFPEHEAATCCLGWNCRQWLLFMVVLFLSLFCLDIQYVTFVGNHFTFSLFLYLVCLQ